MNTLLRRVAPLCALCFFCGTGFASENLEELPTIPFTCQVGVNNPEIVKAQIKKGILVPDTFTAVSYKYKMNSVNKKIIFSFFGFPMDSSDIQTIVQRMGEALEEINIAEKPKPKAVQQYNRALKEISLLIYEKKYPEFRCDRLIKIEVPSQGFFENKFLGGINFSFTNVQSIESLPASFKNSNLSGAKFIGANFSNADFSGALLFSANLEGGQFEGANFTEATLYKANLKQSRSFLLYNTNFKKANFYGTDLSLVRGQNTDFSGASFRNSYFHQSEIVDSSFEQAKFYQDSKAIYYVDGNYVTIDNKVGFNSSLFQNCNFKDTLFYNVDILKSIFVDTDFYRVELSRSRIFDSEYDNGYKGSMNEAYFGRSIIVGTLFKNTSMINSNFMYSMLGPETLFSGKKMNLKGAEMNGSIWYKIDATKFPLDSWANYSGVRYYEVLLPEGINSGDLGLEADSSIVKLFKEQVPWPLLN